MKNPEGEVFGRWKFQESPKGKVLGFWRLHEYHRKERCKRTQTTTNPSEDSPTKKTKWKMKWKMFFMWVLSSVPVFIPQLLFSYLFVFCESLFGGIENLWVDWREVLVPFSLRERFLKGSFGSFQFGKVLRREVFWFPSGWLGERKF